MMPAEPSLRHTKMPVGQPIGLPALLRKLNTTDVLRTIRADGPLSRAQLAKTTGLSQPTVNQIATGLIGAGLVLEESSETPGQPARRGRPGSLLSFNAGAGHVLGIDIGAEMIVVMVADLDGAILARESRSAGSHHQLQPQPLLKTVRTATAAALSSARVDRRSLMAAGVGVPGSVDPKSGAVKLGPALPDWEGFVLAKELDKGLSCPVLVNNDMHLAILAERRFGAARDVENAVYLHIGVGIGLGILIGGAIYTGADGVAGEIAFLPVADEDGAAKSGFGAFEWAAASLATARMGWKVAALAEEGRMHPGHAALRAEESGVGQCG